MLLLSALLSYTPGQIHMNYQLRNQKPSCRGTIPRFLDASGLSPNPRVTRMTWHIGQTGILYLTSTLGSWEEHPKLHHFPPHFCHIDFPQVGKGHHLSHWKGRYTLAGATLLHVLWIMQWEKMRVDVFLHVMSNSFHKINIVPGNSPYPKSKGSFPDHHFQEVCWL